MGMQETLQRVLRSLHLFVRQMAWYRFASVPSQEGHGQQGYHFPSGASLLFREILAQNFPVRLHHQLWGVQSFFAPLRHRYRKLSQETREDVIIVDLWKIEHRHQVWRCWRHWWRQKRAREYHLWVYRLHQESHSIFEEIARWHRQIFDQQVGSYQVLRWHVCWAYQIRRD